MTRWAQLGADGVVIGVVEQDDAPEIGGTWAACPVQVGPGWMQDGSGWTPPAVVRSWPAFEFYRRLTSAERIAVRSLAKTDPIAEDVIHTLDAAIASGTQVRSDDPDLIAGMAYLSATPVGSPVLAPGRAAEITAA